MNLGMVYWERDACVKREPNGALCSRTVPSRNETVTTGCEDASDGAMPTAFLLSSREPAVLSTHEFARPFLDCIALCPRGR